MPRAFGDASVTLTPRPARTLAGRFTRWLARHAGLFLTLSALIALLALAESTRRYRRRLAVLDGPPPEGPLDPNTASEDELARIPGLGPRAAQRIVQDRRARGPFERLADLERLEGFDAERVAEVEPHLRVGSPARV